MEQPNLEPLLYVIGIDPGTNCCGFAIFSIELNSKTIVCQFRFIELAQVNIRTFSLPNLLAGRHLVPELIQDECTAERIAHQVETLLNSDNSALLSEFTRLHQLIRCNADHQAAEAVLELVTTS